VIEPHEKTGVCRFFLVLRIVLGQVQIGTGLASLCVLRAALFISGPRSLACRSFVLVSPLTGESLSLACPRESNQREGHPTIRPRLRRGSLAPSPLQGHAAKGHPWPIAALATSMSLNPLRGDSTRPPEGDLGVVCTIAVEEQRQRPDAANSNQGEHSESRCGARKGRNPNVQQTR